MNVADLMAKDEFIVKSFELKEDSMVHATNKRLFIEKRAYIQDISYQHISSMRIKTSFNIPFIVSGIILAFLGIIALSGIIEMVSESIPVAIPWAFTIVGLILVGVGLVKTQALHLTVVGMNVPVLLAGSGTRLGDIFAIVRGTHTIPPVNK